MKLLRNQTYAVVQLRDLPFNAVSMLNTLSTGGFVEFGHPGTEDEFFVIKLKDVYAPAALSAYADAAQADDPEYASEVRALAVRAANHPNRKKPD